MEGNVDWAEILKSNKTSIEDKLDVILAQNNELKVDTERVASLVPLVTGNESMEQSESMDDASEEIMEDNPEMIDGDAPEGEDDPFAFLDGDDMGEDVSTEDDVVDEEIPDESEQDDIVESEEPTEEPVDESEEQSMSDSDEDDIMEDEESYDDSLISDESAEEPDEDEEEQATAKSYHHKPVRKTRTVQPIRKSNIVSKVNRPTYDYSFGKRSGAPLIAKMLGEIEDEDFEIGYGVDPKKATAKDWEFYYALKGFN